MNQQIRRELILLRRLRETMVVLEQCAKDGVFNDTTLDQSHAYAKLGNRMAAMREDILKAERDLLIAFSPPDPPVSPKRL